MDNLTKREIERRLKDKGLSNRESKIMVSVLSDTLRDMQENPPASPGGLVDLSRFLVHRNPIG
ncbi:MAG: hypothetical protein RBR18_13415 [Desulfovibrionaceae bacterium]|nr:hypothetical protein [Desulfovibrionaceae bacterium]